jgi:hypothetical protein
VPCAIRTNVVHHCRYPSSAIIQTILLYLAILKKFAKKIEDMLPLVRKCALVDNKGNFLLSKFTDLFLTLLPS